MSRQAGSPNLLNTLPQLLMALHLILLKAMALRESGIGYQDSDRVEVWWDVPQQLRRFPASLGYTARLSQIDKTKQKYLPMLIKCDMSMGDSCHNEAILEFFQIQVGHVQPPREIRPLLFQPLTTLNSRLCLFVCLFLPRVSIFCFVRVSLCPFPTFVSEFTRCLVLRGWPPEGSQNSRQSESTSPILAPRPSHLVPPFY